MKRLILGYCALIGGVAVHMLALYIADKWVRSFPSVPDVLMDRWPRIEFGVWGELAFFLLLAFFAFAFFRQSKHNLAQLLVLLGIFYAIRGIFLLLLPIGMPHGAVLPGARFTLYPYGTHAYFPGGHFGILTIMALSLTDKRLRNAMFAGVLLFGFGTVLAKTHYSADLLGGGLLAYGIMLWGRTKTFLPGR